MPDKAAKRKVSISVSPELLAWIEDRIGPGLPFGSVSHAFESGIVFLQEARDPRFSKRRRKA